MGYLMQVKPPHVGVRRGMAEDPMKTQVSTGSRTVARRGPVRAADLASTATGEPSRNLSALTRREMSATATASGVRSQPAHSSQVAGGVLSCSGLTSDRRQPVTANTHLPESFVPLAAWENMTASAIGSSPATLALEEPVVCALARPASACRRVREGPA